ncbi:hypothetical protein ES708_25845 [subsurface metagenome]
MAYSIRHMIPYMSVKIICGYRRNPTELHGERPAILGLTYRWRYYLLFLLLLLYYHFLLLFLFLYYLFLSTRG